MLNKVSIACITYNHEKYIAQALDSFLMQETNFDYEIVIGEDCSTDGTLAIIHEYQAKYPNKIRVVSSAGNVGLAKNFIRTLGACEGKYIAYCDCDDYWTDPTKLQKQYDCLEANSQAICCFHDIAGLVDETGEIIPIKPRSKGYHEFSKEEMMLCKPRIAHQTVMMRNIDLFKQYPKEAYRIINQDTFLFSILGIYGTGIYLPDIKHSLYRRHGNSIWSQSQANELMHVETMNYMVWLSIFFKRMGYHKQAKYYNKRAFRVHTRLVPIGYQFAMAFLRIFKFLGKKR